MKSLLLFLFLSFISFYDNAQIGAVDSSREIINKRKGDSTEVDAITQLGMLQTQFDSGIKYAQLGLSLAEKINSRRRIADCQLMFANAYGNSGNFSQAIEYLLSAIAIYTEFGDYGGIASALLMLQGTYRGAGEYRKALTYGLRGESIADAHNVIGNLVFPGHHLAPLYLAEIAQTYVFMNRLDSASFYTQKAIEQKETFNGADWNFPVYLLATIQTQEGEYRQAQKNFHLSVSLARKNEIERDVLQNFSGLSTMFKKSGVPDSAIYYAQFVAHSALPDLETKNLQEALDNLAELYQVTGNKDSAIKYIVRSYHLRDSMFSREKDRQLQNITFNEKLKQQQIAAEQARYKSRVLLYAMGGGLFVLLLVALLLWRNNLHKQRSKIKVEKAYAELKLTQAQLIQSEKMASLGELTAGIAHEIQNPLNFVNNFSEVNKELLSELKDEATNGNIEQVITIADNVIGNEDKISQHGKRADAIVKGMLQHSRTSSGQKEMTGLNALCDEYLRLAYHGVRAKDKLFNIEIKTNFDSSIGKISVVPQDIGRVILNLINNAFYTVSEKAKLQSALSGYKPQVMVQTRNLENSIDIMVEDNGDGIKSNLIGKIFQPFFTTKPTGQGTGLGLSLAYDIVKSSGGEIKVESKEGEFARFIIKLPKG